jgi:hypothetical protein
VPTSLVSSTVKAASLLAAGQAAIAGLISAKVVALTEGVVITMLLNKLKVLTMVLLAAAIVSGAGLLYRSQAASAECALSKRRGCGPRGAASRPQSPRAIVRTEQQKLIVK